MSCLFLVQITFPPCTCYPGNLKATRLQCVTTLTDRTMQRSFNTCFCTNSPICHIRSHEEGKDEPLQGCNGLFFKLIVPVLHINNQQDAASIHNFYFVTKLYMLRASSVSIISSYQLYTWHLVCFMQVMWPLSRRVRLEPDSTRQRPHNPHETYQLPRVKLITPDDGYRRCKKHVEFRDKIKILDT